MKFRALVLILTLSSVHRTFAQDSNTTINGNWGDWMQWTTCSATCGSGYHVRQRICDNPEPVNGGQNCTGLDYETKHCQESFCPVDGEWGSWFPWSNCTVTCSTGVIFRTRKCEDPVPQHGGKNCEGPSQEFDKCINTPCPVAGGWTNWGQYGACSQTCGINVIRTRTRNCTNPEPRYDGPDCEGNDTSDLACDFVDCKDGTWDDWAEWGDCSTTCGAAVRFRFRSCNQSESLGTCTGKSYESDVCSTPCPVEGLWGSWSGWSQCSVTCSTGVQNRTRNCDDPPAQFGGKVCDGGLEESQTQSCDTRVNCPIDGNWGAWSLWTDCDVTCDGGRRFRLRKCSDPVPQYGGHTCPGLDIETEVCSDTHCPIDGNWRSWFEWSSCSSTCGTGVQNRVRTCSNPQPQYGGAYCVGDLEETMACSVNPDITNCSLDGAWASWGPYGDCSATCEDGVQTRHRTCTNPAPHGNGLQCPGNSSDFLSCTVPTGCAIDGIWSTWRSWFPCSVTCGAGLQTRVRTCTNPKPQHGGKFCVGDQLEDKNCTTSPCTTSDPTSDNVILG